MSNMNTKKPRILYVAKILHEETDAEVGLTLPALQERLEEYGITVERKALYRDFAALEAMGVGIGKIKARPVQYFMSSRLFDYAQLALLIDAVQTSRSITKANSEDLIERLRHLHSKRISQGFDSRIHVAGRVKMQNESVFATLDSIQRAIAEGRDISFDYKRYDVRKNLKSVQPQDGKERVRTPLFLVYADDNYYMLAYDEASPTKVRSYRVDRMHHVMILEEAPDGHRLPVEFDIASYERHTPGMFGGKPQRIHLHVAEDAVSNMIDIFGAEETDTSEAKDVKEVPLPAGAERRSSIPASDEDASAAFEEAERRWASMWIKATPSPVLFGQIFQFGGDVRIVGPASVVRAYDEHIQRVMQAQALSRE